MEKERTVKTKVINGKEYSYFERNYEKGKACNSIQFYQMDVDANYFESLKNVGGMSAKMLKDKPKEHDADRVTILMYTGKNYREFTYVLVEKDGVVVDYALTDIALYQKYIQDFINKNKTTLNGLVVDESLNYMGHPIYGEFMSDYQSPIHAKYTGISYNGRKVYFEDKLVVEGCTGMFGGKEQFDRVIIEIEKDFNAFGGLGLIYFANEDGSKLTFIDSYLAGNEETKGMTAEKYYEHERQKLKDNFQKDLEKFRRKTEAKELNEEEKEERILQYQKRKELRLERDLATNRLDDEDTEAYYTLINASSIYASLNHPDAVVISHKSKYE